MNIKVINKTDFNLPVSTKTTSFMDKAYNQNQTLTSNLRFGILPLSWLDKYSHYKPSIIIFILNTT